LLVSSIPPACLPPYCADSTFWLRCEGSGAGAGAGRRSDRVARARGTARRSMEQYGSTATYNVESVLRKNIMDSEYFRDTCLKLNSWSEVVDEIFYTVKDVEPWMSGNARGASSAFCLLYRSVRWPRVLVPAPPRPACRSLPTHRVFVAQPADARGRSAQAVHAGADQAGGQGAAGPRGLTVYTCGARQAPVAHQ